MPQLPYHKYLGPGNELSGEEPVDTDDAIALQHDSAYETAISAEDILKADEDAILDFWDDFSTSGNWHSLVGAAGLTLKHEVEKQVGVIYPDMSSRQRYKPLSFTNRKEEHEEHQRQQRQGQQQVKRDRTQASDQPSGSRDVSDIGLHLQVQV
ncbi:Phospholipase A2-like domain [Popillia japonica]|uniref:Phospholipase A2-like domain n=1 Tax=Popillia japonica TaxID=7064 RepID=A0AAW1HQX5_POPJA